MMKNAQFFLTGAEIRRAIFLMFASLCIMVLGLSLIYFAPLVYAPWCALILYLILLTLEQKSNALSPVTLTMVIATTALGTLYYLVSDISYLMYATPIIYSVLGSVTAFYQYCRIPITAIYSHGEGYQALHEKNSMIWVFLFFSSAISSWFLMPSVLSIYVPFSLMIFGAIATIFMHFYYMGAKHERQPIFQLSDFTFTEITSDDDIERFNKIVAITFRTEFQRKFGNSKKVSLDKIMKEHTTVDSHYEGVIVRFIVTHGTESVGAVSMFFDHPKKGLPIEDINTKLDLTPYRRKGAIVEICRLSILNKYRLNPLVFKGLLRCMIDLASERQVSYILNDAFFFRLSTYNKIGFTPITEAPQATPEDSLGFGIAMQPLIMDYESVVLLENISPTTHEMYSIINLYITERYFNRMVVRNVVRSTIKAIKRAVSYLTTNKSLNSNV